jgi:hypothetical protein
VNEPIRLLGFFVLVFGVLLLLASLFADPLALGQPGTTFGWKQILGTILGLGLAVLGARMVGLLERRRP